MLDDIAQAVLAREEVVKYLRGDYGERGERGARERIYGYLDELRTTQRHRDLPRAAAPALSDPAEDRAQAREPAPRRRRPSRSHRIVYASNHKSHTDYLVEPLVLDDNGIRPPLIAAGINLFGGPLGLIHRHVTGAIPIRRNTKDPAYLITLKAYVAEMLKKHDLFFYPGGRPQLQRRAEAGEDRADSRRADRRLRRTSSSFRRRSPTTWCSRITSSRGSGSRSGSGPFTRELAEMVRYAVGYRSRAFVTFGAPIPVADCRRRSRAATCSSSPA